MSLSLLKALQQLERILATIKNEDKGLSTSYLLEFCTHTLKLQSFLGVYADDKIPTQTCLDNPKWSMIVNLSPSHDEGSHWVAMARDTEPGGSGTVRYMDPQKLSFVDYPNLGVGVHHLRRRFANELGLLVNNILDRPIQSPLSPLCGFYAIEFCALSDVRMTRLDRPLSLSRYHRLNHSIGYKGNDIKLINNLQTIMIRFDEMDNNIWLEGVNSQPVRVHHLDDERQQPSSTTSV